MKVPYVYEEVEVIVEFYEALCVESTPSQKNEIYEFVLKGLKIFFSLSDIGLLPWVAE